MARDLCEYGKRLSARLRYPGEPPFQNMYEDYGIYLSILAGEDVDFGIAHFEMKAANADPEEEGTNAAEVLVNLLLRLERRDKAVEVARRYLRSKDKRPMSCPPLGEICRQAHDFRTLAEVAREQDDPVHYLAGLLESSG